MHSLLVFCAVCVVATAFADRNTVNEKFLPRPKRENHVNIGNTKYGLKDGVPYVDHKVNLANSNGHKLDANAYASKDVHNNGPLQVGGNLNYAHQPSGAGLNIGGSNVRRGGTRVEAAGVWNLYRNGGLGVDLKGGYSRQFGGQFGSGPPVYGVEIRGGYAFPKRG